MQNLNEHKLNIGDQIVYCGAILFVFGGSLAFILFLLGIGHSIPLNFTSEYLPWIFLEFFLVFLCCCITIMMIKRWLERKNLLTRNILWLFIMYTAGMASTSYTKILKYLIANPVYVPGSYFYNILYEFRFASFFSALAGLFFYRFYLDVFVQKKETIRGKYFVIIFSIITAIVQLLPIFGGLNPLILKSLILIQASMIYFPVSYQSYNIVKRTKFESGDFELYWGFLFLFLLAVFFIGIWISYILSFVTDIVLSQNYGIFYFIMQGFVIAMLFCVYLCFIMPSWFKRFVEKRQKSKAIN